jgi:hypothetical protein
MPGKPYGSTGTDIAALIRSLHTKQPNPHPQYVLEEDMKEELEAVLTELRKITKHLESMTDEKIEDKDVQEA